MVNFATPSLARVRRRVFQLVVCASLTLQAGGAELVIHDTTLHPLPRDLFGQFLERPSWGGEYGPESLSDATGRLPPPVESALAELHAPLVRFPSGTDGDYIDWQDMIDLPGRAARPVTRGHQGNEVTNRFGFPEYFDLARRLGWRSLLVANLRDALYRKKPLAEAAAHAAELLRYGIAYAPANSIAAFQIGNEAWFFWPPTDTGDRTALGLADDETCATWLRTCLVAYADAARTVSATIPLICDAPRPLDGGGLENNTAAIWRSAIDHPDIRARYTHLAAHAYAPLGLWSATRNGEKLVPGTLSEDDVWFGLVAALGRHDTDGQNIADATAYDEIAALGYRTAVTEWNWNGWDFSSRFPHIAYKEGVPAALGAAGFLHGLMRHPRVALATQSLMLGTSWGITAVRVKPDGAIVRGPQSEPTRLYAEHHGTHLLASTLKSVPMIESPVALASWWPQATRIAIIDTVVTADTRALYLHIIQRSRSDSQTLDVRLPAKLPASGTATVHLLTGDTARVTPFGEGEMHRETRTITWADHRTALSLPPASVSVIVFPHELSR